jgi:N6-adenosine-specific RNA methylase IME4
MTQQPRVLTRAPSDEHALERVNGFVDRIAALPVASWLEIGRSIICGTPSTSEHATASVALENAIAYHRLSVVAWLVTDAVETSTFLATGNWNRRSATERLQLSAAQNAAEESALALLTRARLDVASFATLTAPFRTLLS